MRVLHCIASMAQGGAERQVAYLANAHAELGLEVTIALLREGVMLDRLVHATRIEKIAASGNRDPRIVPSIARIIGRVKPDVVQTWLPQMDILGGIATLVRRVPWVLCERSSHLAYGPTLQNRFRAQFGRYADAIVANSAVGLRYWQERKPHAKVLRTIPNAAALPSVEATASALLATAGDRPVIAYVGRFSAEKNLGTLLAALERVLPAHDAVAVFCGAGPFEDAVRADVTARGLDDRVIFAGYVTDVTSILRRADAFVLISRYEGQPNALVEAILCGCPAVLSDIPAHRELLEDDCALFADGTDIAAVAEALSSTLRNQEAARARAVRASSRASRFAPANVAAEYEEVYRAVTEQRR